MIDRCGVIAGPWQMGKVDQGVFTHWMLAHHFRRPLSYIGFGGGGKQVRDLLHVEDLVDLVEASCSTPRPGTGVRSTSAAAASAASRCLRRPSICRRAERPRGPDRADRGDPRRRRAGLPLRLRQAVRADEWRPRRGAGQMLADIHEWVAARRRSGSPAALEHRGPRGGRRE